MDTYSTVYNYSPQYSFCAVYICYSFHNVIFFHNHCPIHSTTMSTAYPQHIHTVLFTITQPSILYVLFTYASFSQCDIISQSLHNWLYNNVYSISSTYTYGIVTITLPSILTLLFIYASFTQCDIFPQWLHNWLYNNVYSIFSTYTYNTIYNYTTQYTNCAVYIYFPFHNVNIFPQYYIIVYSTMFTVRLHWTLTVLFTITLPSILTLLFIYASFTQCDIFSQSLPNSLYNNVYSISATYTYSTVYNYTTQYTVCAFYICFLFTMWYYFTITAQFTLQQCLQHILNIYIQYYLQLHYPVYWLCCLHRLSFSRCDIFPQWLHNSLYNNVYSIFSTYTYNTIYNYTTQYTNCAVYIYFPFHNVNIFPQYYIIVYSTMFTVRLHWTLTVLFTITLPSILTLLFIYASFTQCDIFSQSLPNSLYNNVYSISATYTYSTVYNYTTQYTVCAFYICFLFTMWYYFTITAQFTLQQCLQHILNIYIQYYLQLHYPVYWLCCLHRLSFSRCDIFPQWLHNSLYNNVYSISSSYTYGIVYNYSIQYTDFAVYICFLYTMWHFFTITAQLTLQQCLQHIRNIYI